jgi:hypothetical protein
MARLLVGDTTLSLAVYELVADEMEMSLELIPWAPIDKQAPDHVVETVADSAQRRVKSKPLDQLGCILKPPPGTPPLSIDDISL